MALSVTALSPAKVSGLIPGLGFATIVQAVWDNSFLTTGEVCDLSGIFANEVFGGTVIADTLNDGGYKCTYVRDTAGAPATGVLQAYGNITVSGGTFSPLQLALTTWDLSAMNGQYWIFFGR